MSDDAQVALTAATVVSARIDAHEKVCGERYQQIMCNSNEIKETLRTISADLKGAVERIHTRIEDNASSARHSLNNAVAAARVEMSDVAKNARAEAKVAMDFAQDAHDEIRDQRSWVLGGIVTFLVTLLLTVGGWCVDHFWNR